MGFKPLHPGYATDWEVKIFSVLQKIKTTSLSKKCFHVLIHVIITSEVPVTILQD